MLLFAHDAHDARFLKRLRSFRDSGFVVSWIGYDRGRETQAINAFLDEFPHLLLGRTFDENYFQRAMISLKTLCRFLVTPGILREAQLHYCTNLENLAVLLFLRLVWRLQAKVIYEVPDIQPAMLRSNLQGRILRFVERVCLKNVDLLTVTSPAFLTEFLLGKQGYGGPAFLLENKVYFGPGQTVVDTTQSSKGSQLITVGLFGQLKCQRSLRLIGDLARRFSGKLRFVLRGYCGAGYETAVSDLVKEHGNVTFAGRYSYPDDLGSIYGEIDLCWGFDFRAPGGNSKWCLANRIYEAGLYGVPILVEDGTTSGDHVKGLCAGWALPEPLGETLTGFFEKISRAELVAKRAFIRGLNQNNFLLNEDLVRLQKLLASPC